MCVGREEKVRHGKAVEGKKREVEANKGKNETKIGQE